MVDDPKPEPVYPYGDDENRPKIDKAKRANGKVTHVGEAIDASIDTFKQMIAEREIELVSEEELQRFDAKHIAQDRLERLEKSSILERLDERGHRAIVDDQPLKTRALHHVQTWLLSSRPMLMLLGDTGLGKTCAAAWALARKRGYYIKAAELADMRLDKSEKHRYYQYARCGLLVIDELGSERDKGEAIATFDDIIDIRQHSPRRTLLLGNLSKAELIDRYGKRSLSRLGPDRDEDGLAIIRKLTGEDLRRFGATVES